LAILENLSEEAMTPNIYTPAYIKGTKGKRKREIKGETEKKKKK
jgi:hypothetical protein